MTGNDMLHLSLAMMKIKFGQVSILLAGDFCHFQIRKKKRRTLRVGRPMGRPKIGRSPRRTIMIRRSKFTAVRDLHFAPCFSET
jgi:hypothetical protein